MARPQISENAKSRQREEWRREFKLAFADACQLPRWESFADQKDKDADKYVLTPGCFGRKVFLPITSISWYSK